MRLFELSSYAEAKPFIEQAAQILAKEFYSDSSTVHEYNMEFWDDYYDELEELGAESPYDVGEYVRQDPALKQAYEAGIEGWARSRAEDAYTTVNYEVKKSGGDHAVLYREITSSEEWPEQIGQQPLGIYWSFNPETEHQWGDSNDGYFFMMTAHVPHGAIDWVYLILQNANPAYEWEKEVRLLKGSTVRLVDVQEHNGSGAWYPTETPMVPGDYPV